MAEGEGIEPSSVRSRSFQDCVGSQPRHPPMEAIFNSIHLI